MATRGIKQLIQLNIIYCEHGGSSRTIREFISSKRIIEFCNQNPSVNVNVNVRNGHHPYMEGNYRTGKSKQICIKNEPMKRIGNVLNMLNNSSGRKISKISKPIITQTPSIQGVWTPMLDIDQQSFEIQYM